MAPLLYLDTARLGQMTPAAKDAQLDFVRLSAEEPSSLYFEEFLRYGFSAWPAYYQTRFPNLATWNGVAGLKQSLRRVAGAPADWQVLLASRSLSLVQLAAHSMYRVCRNVLATDLSWPKYQETLDHRAARTENCMTTVSLRGQILRCNWSTHDIADHLARHFVEHQCDGLFLPAVDHLGIRLPVGEIVRNIERRAELRFVFIDAAQAFCHVPLDESFACADFIVAGTHKWLRAYLPMGPAFFGRRRSRRLIQNTLRQVRPSAYTTDPLLSFTEQLEHDNLDRHSETANLSCLFTAAGAIADAAPPLSMRAKLNECELRNLRATTPNPSDEWQSLFPTAPMRSRIVIFESISASNRISSPDVVRERWLAAGAIISAYPGGLVRLSLPQRPQIAIQKEVANTFTVRNADG